jgi:sugar-specific transcriptional regulator TrmB
MYLSSNYLQKSITVVTILNMSTDEIVKRNVRALGFTDAESRVYIFLAKCGPLKGAEIAQNLKIPKAQVYHILKSLQGKGWVQSTIEFPARFAAAPLAELIDSQVKLKREEATSLESAKNEMLYRWSLLYQDQDKSSPERFVIIEGTNKIAVKILQMVEDAKDEFKILMSGYPLTQNQRATQTGLEVFKKLKKSQVKTRVLSQVSKDDYKMIEESLEKASRIGREGRLEARHFEDSSFKCTFATRDKKETLLYLTPRPTSKSAKDQNEIALWTNSTTVASVFNFFFEKLWSDAPDARKKIAEITSMQQTKNDQSKTPVEETQ